MRQCGAVFQDVAATGWLCSLHALHSIKLQFLFKLMLQPQQHVPISMLLQGFCCRAHHIYTPRYTTYHISHHVRNP